MAPTVASVPAVRPKKRSRLPYIVVTVLVLAGAAVGAQRYLVWRAQPENNASMRRGMALWQQRNAAAAETEFASAANQLPRSALPHIYLARLKRERGDLAGATQEATRAAQLEPDNALALREAATVFMARGDNERARRLFVRALRVNPGDRTSMGWLACSLQRLGEVEQAARWAGRAGAGPWSACLR
jgi:cytochrome c-type biogenesis protein CcmH/NrfG